MKQLFLLPIIALALTAQARPSVEWQTLGNQTDADGKANYVQRFVIVADGPFSRLAFNQFARKMEPLSEADSLIELVPGYYAVESDRFSQAAPGDTITVDLRTFATLRSINYAPDGAHLVSLDGSPVAVDYTRASMLERPDQWATATDDHMPYGPEVFARNAELKSDFVPGPYDVVPSYKSVRLTGGQSKLPSKIEFHEISDPRPDFYRITVADGRVLLECAPSIRAQAERMFLRNTAGRGFSELPNAVIEHWPDLEYRGMMIDVARNFVSPAELSRILNMMADYGLNTLHFHFADDEAWRLQFDSLPELTEVGGRRGYTTDEADFLMQIFTGSGDPADTTNSSNGYFTRSEFVAMLRLADSLGIKVLPEIESPGHGRAAILAMQKRARTTGDDSWLLRDPDDTSVYTSAQSFHDNAMNPAMPGIYKLMETLARELKDMYAEAGLTLEAIHIGGDEVPRNAWQGSPIAQAYMKEKGYTTQRELHEDYIRRINDIYAGLGVKIAGWQEMGVGHPDEYNAEIAPNTFSLNCWSTLASHGNASVTTQAVQAGYPIILSNVDHNYFDLCYSRHPLETGLTWGGTVDEFASLSAYRDSLVVVPEGAPGCVKGISAQLFGETIRSDSQLERYILPKIAGLGERAWNAVPTYSEPHFQSIITLCEMPAWQREGYNYHLRQPGIRLADGLIEMNTPYGPDAAIRYTTDGSDPTAESPLYTAPLPASGIAQVRAIITLGGKQSVPTILYL